MPKTRIINGNVVKENISYERESINQVDFRRRLDCAFLYFVEIHILRIIFICKYRYIFPYMNIQRSKNDYPVFQCELFNGSKDHFFDITFITECAHDFMVTSKKHGFVHISAQFDFPPKNTCTSDQQ